MSIFPKISSFIYTFIPLILVLLFSAGPADAAKEQPRLRVYFGDQSAEIQGELNSESDAEIILAAVREVRPDLALDRERLIIQPGKLTPNLKDLRSLLAEIAISTYQGLIEIYPDRLVVGGLTDSIVTRSAVRIRAKPLLVGRTLIDHVCIVTPDDLPSLDIALASGQVVAPALVAEVVEQPSIPQAPFEAPGLRLETLLSTLRLLDRIDSLAGRSPAPQTSPITVSLRAMPLEEESPATGEPGAIPQEASPSLPRREMLPSLYFSRNSFFLQTDQAAVLETIAKQLLSSESSEAPIQLDAIVPAGGSTAFNEYLGERRTAEVVKLLQERGVSASRFRINRSSATASFDSGEIRLSVEIPVVPSTPTANENSNSKVSPGATPAEAIETTPSTS